MRCTSFIIFLLACNNSLAQSLSGRVLSVHGEPLIGASVYEETDKIGTITDLDGHFKLDDISSGNIIIRVSYIGFKTQKYSINLAEGENKKLEIELEQDLYSLKAFNLIEKSDATKVREASFSVEVVESKAFKNLSTNANDILGRVSGVNIRQSGGVGSAFSLSLNGLSGNQVRIFLDGIPMDYFGSSLSLNNFSANLIDRIEVYKGVVPIHLSSDALGGAINVLTKGRSSNYLDTSVSLGSFGTRLASLNTQHRFEKSGLTLRLKSFFNQSANNYMVPVLPVDFSTGKEAEEEIWVERFHDAYQSAMIWAEIGWTGIPLADELTFGILGSQNYKELQQDANAIGQAKIPYGEVTTEEEKIISNFAYRKNGLFKDRLNLNTYAVYIQGESLSKDTASVRYDWFGDSYPKLDNTTGEIELRKTLLKLKTKNLLSNANAEWTFKNVGSLAINHSLNHLFLEGNDPLKLENNTQFSQPSTVLKQVLAANYSKELFSKKLKASVFAKYYNYSINSLETNYQGTEITPFNNIQDFQGTGFSTSYTPNKLQLKFSFEKAIRFPEIIELFGDGLNVKSNPLLKPEKSKNYNFGISYNNSSKLNPFYLTLNTFIRDSEDFIIPLVIGLKVEHINSTKVLSRGIDIAASYSWYNKIFLNAGATYLDLRDNERLFRGLQGIDNPQYKVRLPNVPYFFGNANLSYRARKLFFKRDAYSVSWTQAYVHEFYYRWENLASTGKSVVPAQLTSNLEFVYSLQDSKYNISLGINNLFDAEVYDNFQQLRPGRNYNLKLRYFLN